MNPLVAAQQIAAAAARTSAAAKLPRLAYSTVTGDAPRPAPQSAPQAEEAHCFVCGRHTDHFAEHDAFVEVGVAEYDSYSGSVYKTLLWDERPDLVQAARDAVDAEVAAWLARIEA